MSSNQTCHINGCNKPCFVDPKTKIVSITCSRYCRNKLTKCAGSGCNHVCYYDQFKKRLSQYCSKKCMKTAPNCNTPGCKKKCHHDGKKFSARCGINCK